MKESNYISVMLDGATDSSVTENEAICVTYLHDRLPLNHLVFVTVLSHAHADGVTDCIQSSVSKFGLDDWKQKLVGFCAGGANVNMGQTAGVVAKLRVDNPELIDIHCMALRLELALLGVLKELSLVSRVNDTLHLICKTYHFRKKKHREPKPVFEELESRFFKPKPVKRTRWVPHLD